MIHHYDALDGESEFAHVLFLGVVLLVNFRLLNLVLQLWQPGAGSCLRAPRRRATPLVALVSAVASAPARYRARCRCLGGARHRRPSLALRRAGYAGLHG